MPRTTRSAQKTILSHKQQQEMRQKQAGVTFLEDDFDDTEEEDVLQTQMVLTMPDVQDADGNTKDDDAEDGEDDYVAPASAPASDMKNEQHSTPRTSISRTVSMTKKASQQGTSSGGTKQKLPPISSSSKESSVHETQQSPPWAWRQKKQQQQSASPAGGPMVVAPPTDRGRSSILATDPAGGPPPATGDPATVAASTAAAVDFPSAAKSPPPPPRNGSTSKLSSSSQNSPVPHTATTPRSIPQQKKNALGALQADVIEYVQELIFNQQEGRAANWALLEVRI